MRVYLCSYMCECLLSDVSHTSKQTCMHVYTCTLYGTHARCMDMYKYVRVRQTSQRSGCHAERNLHAVSVELAMAHLASCYMCICYWTWTWSPRTHSVTLLMSVNALHILRRPATDTTLLSLNSISKLPSSLASSFASAPSLYSTGTGMRTQGHIQVALRHALAWRRDRRPEMMQPPHASLTVPVPAQGSQQQSDHDVAFRCVPGPHISPVFVSWRDSVDMGEVDMRGGGRAHGLVV
jgi:hypothetical protein